MSTIRPDIIAMFEHALQHGFAQSRVDLRGKFINDSMMPEICSWLIKLGDKVKVLENHKLSCSLGNNKITDVGVGTLAGTLVGNPIIQELSLVMNKGVTDISYEYLYELARKSNIKKINLYGTEVPLDKQEQLAELLTPPSEKAKKHSASTSKGKSFAAAAGSSASNGATAAASSSGSSAASASTSSPSGKGNSEGLSKPKGNDRKREAENSSELKPQNDVRISKMLSKVLRHTAVERGLKVSEDGFVYLSDILSLKEFKGIDVDTVKRIVAGNDKQRFSLRENEENGVIEIRANQGHSITVVKSEELLERIKSIEDVPRCVHGTYARFWDSILKNGLSKMTRTHIHFATGDYGSKDVISGMRSTCEVLIHLDVKAVLADNIPLYKSSNGVILCEGIGEDGILPSKYFKRVEDKRTGKILFTNNGSAASST